MKIQREERETERKMFETKIDQKIDQYNKKIESLSIEMQTKEKQYNNLDINNRELMFQNKQYLNNSNKLENEINEYKLNVNTLKMNMEDMKRINMKEKEEFTNEYKSMELDLNKQLEISKQSLLLIENKLNQSEQEKQSFIGMCMSIKLYLAFYHTPIDVLIVISLF